MFEIKQETLLAANTKTCQYSLFIYEGSPVLWRSRRPTGPGSGPGLGARGRYTTQMTREFDCRETAQTQESKGAPLAQVRSCMCSKPISQQSTGPFDMMDGVC